MCLLTLSGHALAAPIAIIDQQQLLSCCGAGIVEFGPVGQEFTPTLPGVDAVELLLVDDLLAQQQEDGVYHVLIRQDTIDGPIVGTSADVVVPDGIINHSATDS